VEKSAVKDYGGCGNESEKGYLCPQHTTAKETRRASPPASQVIYFDHRKLLHLRKMRNPQNLPRCQKNSNKKTACGIADPNRLKPQAVSNFKYCKAVSGLPNDDRDFVENVL